MRLFVAIEAPQSWRDAAVEAQQRLRGALAPDVARGLRPTAPEHMHLTLRFIGETAAGGVPDLRRTLDALPPFEVDVTLGRAITFGQDARTSIVALRIDRDRDALAELAARIDAAVAETVGVPRETRPYNPHLTLARVDRRLDADARRAIAVAVRALPPPAPAWITARECALVRSHLGGRGTRYEVLSRHPA